MYHDSINPPTSNQLKRESPGTNGGAAYRKMRKRAGVRGVSESGGERVQQGKGVSYSFLLFSLSVRNF
jgi:hypothetical protein